MQMQSGGKRGWMYFDDEGFLSCLRPSEYYYIHVRYTRKSPGQMVIKERTKVGLILPYTVRASPATRGLEQGIACDVHNMCITWVTGIEGHWRNRGNRYRKVSAGPSCG